MVQDVGAWWRDAVFYQLYIRSFADSDGDGVGDLEGIRQHLDHLRDLGVDALWITPFYRSPMVDHGYDVADYRAVDPTFGTVDDVVRLVADAHAHSLRVVLDIVPNHTSDQHAWFREALAAGRGSPERERYWFRDGRGPDGSEPPNNWPSIFGDRAWTRVADGQWYLHLFAAEQPDLNWDHPDVQADMARTLEFWLERGVDGFRFDVAHGMAKPPGLPDIDAEAVGGIFSDARADVRFNQPGVHVYHRLIRRTMDDYQARSGRVVTTVGEVWERDPELLSRYVRPDELHSVFNFSLLQSGWDVAEFRAAITDSLAAMALVDGSPTWVLSNHDKQRHATRYGGGELGARRARAAALLELALPGAPYVYNGDELGLEDVPLPDAAMQDPQWLRSGGSEPSRDPSRIPLPWSGDAPPYGFSPSPVPTWLPQPTGWGGVTVAAQSADPGSMLSLYRAALAIRRREPDLRGGAGFRWLEEVGGAAAGGESAGGASAVLAFVRGAGLVCVVNMGPDPVALPAGEVLLASAGLVDGALPGDSAVWLRG